jgi:hypothetical protein
VREPPIGAVWVQYGRRSLAAHNGLLLSVMTDVVLVLVISGCPLAVPGEG